MPILIFNKDIFEETTQGKKKIEDVVSHTIKWQGNAKIKLINVEYKERSSNTSIITLDVNGSTFSFADGTPFLNKKGLLIDKYYLFNNEDITIKAISLLAFEFTLAYEFYN